MAVSTIRRLKSVSFLLASWFFAGVTVAAEPTSFSDLSVDCNENGAIVTVAGGPTYYLGKECDALLLNVGEGRWWHTASAFVVEINGQAVNFDGELDCDLPRCKAG